MLASIVQNIPYSAAGVSLTRIGANLLDWTNLAIAVATVKIKAEKDTCKILLKYQAQKKQAFLEVDRQQALLSQIDKVLQFAITIIKRKDKLIDNLETELIELDNTANTLSPTAVQSLQGQQEKTTELSAVLLLKKPVHYDFSIEVKQEEYRKPDLFSTNDNPHFDFSNDYTDLEPELLLPDICKTPSYIGVPHQADNLRGTSQVIGMSIEPTP
jgi:hypothetical protein